jgi:hypothetical protein
LGDKIEKNVMGGACRVKGVRRGVYRWGNLVKEATGETDAQMEGLILRCIFRKWDVGVWTGWSWLRIGKGGGHL